MGIVTFAVAGCTWRHGASHYLTSIQSNLNAPAYRSTLVLHHDETVSGEVLLGIRALHHPSAMSKTARRLDSWQTFGALPRRALTTWAVQQMVHGLRHEFTRMLGAVSR